MNSSPRRSTLRTLGTALSVLLLGGIAAGQGPEDNGDIRQTVARISFLKGNVSYLRGDDPDNWQAADTNVPMTIGDRIWTGDDGRAELQVHGGFIIRVGALADLAALNLSDDTKQWSLNAGYAAFQVKQLGEDEVFEVDTPNAAITFERTGEYRVDVGANGNTRVTVRRGRALVAAGGGQVPLSAGDEMSIDGIDSPRYDIAAMGSPDSFDRWVSERQRRSEASRSRQYVNDSIVGVADLDEHGRWQSVPSYGMAWTPTVIEAGWQPYRAGHWIWQDPWGWTWVAAEPWGWAPYHYGRWVNWSSRWWWVPGARSHRVDYSPALVAFSGGGPGWSAGAGGFVGWFPLAPRDPFIHWWGPHRRGNDTSFRYTNRVYITVVNHNTFVSGGIVTTNWVRDRSVVATIQQAPILRGPLPIMPTQASLRVAVRPGLPQPFQPPRAVVARAVVVRAAPPPPPPSFRAKVSVIEKNNGSPVAPAEAARLSISDRRSERPVIATRPVSEDKGRVTFAPKSDNSRQPKPEPVTYGRGRAPVQDAAPAAKQPPSQAPTSQAPTSQAPPPDRGRRPDVPRRDEAPPPTPALAPPPPTNPPPGRGMPPDVRRRPEDRGRPNPPTPAAAPPTAAPAPASQPDERGRRPVDVGRPEPKPTPAAAVQPPQDNGRPTPAPRPTPLPREERRRELEKPREAQQPPQQQPAPQPPPQQQPPREERQRPTPQAQPREERQKPTPEPRGERQRPPTGEARRNNAPPGPTPTPKPN